MNRIIFSVVIIFFLVKPLLINAQENEFKQIRFGFMFGLAFFNPSGVNNDISNTLDAQNVMITSGFSGIIMNLNLKFNFSYYINERSSLSGYYDMAFAPKFIAVTNGNDQSFNFSRISPGIVYDYFFGSKEYRKFDTGAGFFYNIMNYNNYSASILGYRLQAGPVINMGKRRIKFLGVLNIMSSVNATNGSKNVYLNYTDIGFNLGYEF